MEWLSEGKEREDMKELLRMTGNGAVADGMQRKDGLKTIDACKYDSDDLSIERCLLTDKKRQLDNTRTFQCLDLMIRYANNTALSSFLQRHPSSMMLQEPTTGDSLLHLYMRYGSPLPSSTVKLILSHADLNLKNARGELPEDAWTAKSKVLPHVVEKAKLLRNLKNRDAFNLLFP